MILAIIQARMGSTRLPGKSLMAFHGKPMVQWVIEAAQQATKIDKVIIATSTSEEDKPLVKFASQFVDVFTGSLYDVLGRYYWAALQYKPDHVVRLTGDCPLLMPRLIDGVIELHLRQKNGYTWNRDSWPSGFDVEVFTFDVLQKAYIEATTAYDREHVTTYIRNWQLVGKIGSYGDGKFPGKWSIDTMADYENVSDGYYFFKECLK